MFLKAVLPLVRCQRLNCYRSSITRFSRDVYSRLYPNYLVLPDGSTIRIRYSEPRHLVKVNFDVVSNVDRSFLLVTGGHRQSIRKRTENPFITSISCTKRENGNYIGYSLWSVRLFSDSPEKITDVFLLSVVHLEEVEISSLSHYVHRPVVVRSTENKEKKIITNKFRRSIIANRDWITRAPMLLSPRSSTVRRARSPAHYNWLSFFSSQITVDVVALSAFFVDGSWSCSFVSCHFSISCRSFNSLALQVTMSIG